MNHHGDLVTKMNECVLCKIAHGELPSRKVYEDNEYLDIVDSNSCAEGHCLVVPKEHVVRFYEMDDEKLCHLFRTVKTVAGKIKKAFNPDFVCVFIRGGRIPHLHVAVFPSMQNDSLSGFPQSSFEEVKVDVDAVAMRLAAIDDSY